MKLLAIGDLHLDCSLHGRAYFDDVRAAMEEIPRDVPAVQLGDVTDPDHGARTFRALEHYADWIRLRGNVATHTLVGNHDCIDDARASASIAMLLDVIVSPRMRPIKKGLGALFLPWVSAAQLPRGQSAQAYLDEIVRVLLDSMSKGDRVIVFCHLDLPGVDYGGERDMPRLGSLTLPEWVLDDPRVELVIAGHIHKAQQRGKLVVVGSLVPLGFEDGKDDAKGYITLDL